MHIIELLGNEHTLYSTSSSWCSLQVQAVTWNHHEPQVLLSGSFGHSVVMVIKIVVFCHLRKFDTRTYNCNTCFQMNSFWVKILCFDVIAYELQKDPGFRRSITADVESLAWDPYVVIHLENPYFSFVIFFILVSNRE